MNGRTESRVSESGAITGQALASLSAAPLAQSLRCLGLRNRHSIGHLDLLALGPKVRKAHMVGGGWPGGGKVSLRGLMGVA